MIKGVIFDFDGTIVDTESLWFEVYRDILLEAYNHQLNLQDFGSIIGTVDDVLYEMLEKEIGSTFQRQWLHEEVAKHFSERKAQLFVREGVRELIQAVQNKGLKLAIASSSGTDWIEAHLRRFDLHSYFPMILSKDHVSKVKPDPELYIKTLEKMELEPYEVIAIEDSGHGAHAAVKAGIQTIVVPNPVTSFLTFPEEAQRFEDFHSILQQDWLK